MIFTKILFEYTVKVWEKVICKIKENLICHCFEHAEMHRNILKFKSHWIRSNFEREALFEILKTDSLLENIHLFLQSFIFVEKKNIISFKFFL